MVFKLAIISSKTPSKLFYEVQFLNCFIMFLFTLGIIIFLILIFLSLFSFYLSASRISVSKAIFVDGVAGIISSPVGKILLIFLFSVLLMANLLGNVPLTCIPTMFYSFTLTVSILFWVPLILCVSVSQLKEFLAHMLPYGSPIGLILFLPLVEIFSQIIRPFTLIIRLSTNLSAGHIIMYMFSYFTLLSSVLIPFIYIVLILLFVLELCISALQAYIFVSLVSLYINETT